MALYNSLNAYGNPDRIIYGDMETDKYGVLSGVVTRRRMEPADRPIFELLLPGAEPPFPVPCVRRTRTYKEGFAFYTYRYEGVADTNSLGDDRVFCELEGSDSESPIETHPLIDTLMEKYNGRVVQHTAVFERKLKDGTPNPLFGVTHFLSLGLIWSRTRITRALPAGIVSKQGCISRPLGHGNVQPPELGGKRNWLELAPTFRERGNVIQLTERWLASGRNGWNPDIYTEKGVS